MSKARDLANAADVLDDVSATELGYVNGVTSAIQTQIDSKIGQATAINPTIVDAKGDIIAGTAADTVSRLAVGANGTVLKANSATATGLEWGTVSGGQLTETAFTSSNASWTIPTGVTGIWALVIGGGGGGGASGTASLQNQGGGGGAGQVKEQFFTVSGDTTLNITIGGGGAGGTNGGKGSNGSTSTIVGNTSATTYVTCAGGGGGGGGTTANITGNSAASGGGQGDDSTRNGGGGGGFMEGATNAAYGVLGGSYTSITVGDGALATTAGVTGNPGGLRATANRGGRGILIWNRAVAGGGNGGAAGGIATNFGAGNVGGNDAAGTAATANTGSGGGGGSTNTTTARNGGAGGSGLVVLRYIA